MQHKMVRFLFTLLGRLNILRKVGDRYFDHEGNEFEVIDIRIEEKPDGTIITVENAVKVS